MRVFISSLMSGRYAQLREAAVGGIQTLGHEPVRAEDHQASPDSPQSACLSEVRSADAVVLILGPDYGSPQASGLSATHEEYREARNEAIPVLAFVEEDVESDEAQSQLIQEVQNWERGQYTGTFATADDLQAKVTRVLHELLLTQVTTAIDGEDLVERARELIPDQTHALLGGGPLLVVSVAGNLTQVIRPRELEGEELNGFLKREALTGNEPVLDTAFGTSRSIGGETITLAQQGTGAYVSLSQAGSVVVAIPAIDQSNGASGIPAIVLEHVEELISRALRFIGGVLDHVDQPRRISHVAIITAVLNSGSRPWRTREEQAQSPNFATMNYLNRDRLEASPTPPTKPRAALTREAESLSEDLTVILRRQATEGHRLVL